MTYPSILIKDERSELVANTNVKSKWNEKVVNVYDFKHFMGSETFLLL